MRIGDPQREIYVEPLELPAPLRREEEEPALPVERPEREPVLVP